MDLIRGNLGWWIGGCLCARGVDPDSVLSPPSTTQTTTNPPPQIPPNQVHKSSPSLRFVEREKRGIPTNNIRREWASVTKEEESITKGTKPLDYQEHPLHIRLHQYLPGKLFPDELPYLQPFTRVFAKGKLKGENFSPAMAFIVIKGLSLATNLRSLIHQPLGKWGL